MSARRQYAVLRRYVPGRDATARGFEKRVTWYGNGNLGVWAEYTDKEGGTLTHFAFCPQELRRLLAFLKRRPRRRAPGQTKGPR